MKLSVIIPTTGRESLGAAKASCAGADEIIVVPDATGDNGYTPRMKGIAQATGTHLAFLDDDDIYTPDAIRLFKEAAADVPVIFRMDHYRHGTLWRDPVLEFGNVSTQMFVVPNLPDKLGVWAPHAPGLREPGGDYTFLKGCVDRMGTPIWRDEIISILRPDFKTISIVTPWLDHPELATGYLRAVENRSPRDELLVVDNCSQQPISYATVRLDKNQGFHRACNTGLNMAKSDVCLFLNNDIVPVDPYWLETIRDTVEPGVLVGAELRNDPHGNVDGQQLPYLDGWCLAGMTQDLRDLGGFDEAYDEPSYYGDNDLSLRARAAGMTLREAKVPLIHLRNRTSGGTANPAVQSATLANRERFANLARELMGVAA